MSPHLSAGKPESERNVRSFANPLVEVLNIAPIRGPSGVGTSEYAPPHPFEEVDCFSTGELRCRGAIGADPRPDKRQHPRKTLHGIDIDAMVASETGIISRGSIRASIGLEPLEEVEE